MKKRPETANADGAAGADETAIAVGAAGTVEALGTEDTQASESQEFKSLAEMFQDTPISAVSPQSITFIRLRLSRGPVFVIKERVCFPIRYLTLSSDKKTQIRRQKALIHAADTPEALAELFGEVDASLEGFLIRKALKYDKAMTPILLRRLQSETTLMFLESAILFLYWCRSNPCEAILEVYDEIYSGYTQSLLCIIVGMRSQTRQYEWMYTNYYNFIEQSPGKGYEQGAMIGMYEMNVQFREYAEK